MTTCRQRPRWMDCKSIHRVYHSPLVAYVRTLYNVCHLPNIDTMLSPALQPLAEIHFRVASNACVETPSPLRDANMWPKADDTNIACRRRPLRCSSRLCHNWHTRATATHPRHDSALSTVYYAVQCICTRRNRPHVAYNR
jgi:hypothetical protein